VRDSEGGSTYCPGCGRAVAVRDWYRMLRYGLTAAVACEACGTLVAGVYDGPVEHWGARRLPLFVGG
jgi:pyruvate formate lyase activating enzyme